jgi:hypothetical protein
VEQAEQAEQAGFVVLAERFPRIFIRIGLIASTLAAVLAIRASWVLPCQ